MIGEDDRGDGMRVLCVRRGVGWMGHGCGHDASVERATGAVGNDNDDEEGERRERREEEGREDEG